MITRTPLRTGKVRVTFRVPKPLAERPVSLVGTFNGWEPGRHPLVRRADGSASVSVTLTPGPQRFRYLGDGGVWFDDDEADHLDPSGGHLFL